MRHADGIAAQAAARCRNGADIRCAGTAGFGCAGFGCDGHETPLSSGTRASGSPGGACAPMDGSLCDGGGRQAPQPGARPLSRPL
ncbi:hypothetical protein GCM10011505_39310 [Tistrella bauzanensis]|uniref:Uncharacterized protein n=1 Tax=Tistrella bauzanensis TaxID=657419 RepID=A0ABQ1IYM9_9PROT|nr:hypothetical protein GCM10011505_39310 [Tistrella bauzanensis]